VSSLLPTSPSGALAGFTSRLDFSALLTQDTRLLKLHTALPELALLPERLVMREALSQPYELTLDALSTSRHLALKALIGQQLTVERLGSDGAYHPWHGYVFEAAQLGGDGGLARYRLVMRPWLSLLALRRDSRVFQGLCAQAIVERVFAGFPQAEFSFQLGSPLRPRSLCTQYQETDLDFVQRLLAEEGLHYHFEQLASTEATAADQAGRARHRLVVTDAQAQRPDLGEVRFTSAHASAWQPGQRDAVTRLAVTRHVAATAAALGAWDYKALGARSAQAATADALGALLPSLEHYDGSGAYRYPDDEAASAAAWRAMQGLELGYERHEGQGSARHFTAGARFQLVEHSRYGGPSQPDGAFALLAVEHHVANNLGAGMAELLGAPDIEQGGYRNSFHAVAASTPLLPRFVRKPTAPGLQSAVVVGLANESLTTDRDLRVKIQFPWQRGERPLAGGLSAPTGGLSGSPDHAHHAPGDERSGTWVRVAQPSAGANWGSVFVPRIGTEVAVQFVEADIDRPLIAGQLYNGQDRPPFAAGVDSGVNHPGVISGLASRALDGAGANALVLDDATGQLRTSLQCAYAQAELALGHLIAQSDTGAWRGAWRGTGLLACTRGWATLRAGAGLLVSTAARPGRYGSAEGTQMDAAEALAQLNAGRDLGQRLGEAAQAGLAQGLPSHDEAQALDQAAQVIDPQRDGRHGGPVNGQAEFQAGDDGRTPGTDPVETFARPQLVLHSASTQAWASPASLMSWAGQATSWVAQAELHQAAAHTYAQVSGKGSSLYTHAGGAKLIAANGPLSVRAHTDAMQLWADQSITIASVNDEIRIQAQTRIELVGGSSSLVLDGADITFTCPGQFDVKGSLHAFEGGGSQAAALEALPQGAVGEIPTLLELRYTYRDLAPVAGAAYLVRFANGTVRQGQLDDRGEARIDNPPGVGEVFFGFDARSAVQRSQRSDNPLIGQEGSTPQAAAELLDRYLAQEDDALNDMWFTDELAALDASGFDDQTGDYTYTAEAAPPTEESAPGHHDEVVLSDGGAP
jgi:type VI secretion system secreted protein VgrG